MDTSTFSPVRGKKTYLQIVDALVDQIAQGKLEYGDRLYTESELLELLEVSRPTLREALRVMEFLGIVTVAPHNGIRISSPQADRGYLPLIYCMVFERISQRDLFELRESLQVEMAPLAALRRTPQDLERLLACVAEMERSLQAEDDRFAQLDYDFHLEVIRCSGNFAALKLMNTFGTLIQRQLRQTIREMPRPQRVGTLDYHTRIARAIQQQDPAQARSLMYEHLGRSRQVNASQEQLQFRLDRDL